MSFDALAPHYRWMEFLAAGNKLQRCRTAFLHKVSASRNALILGEGNGRFLLECRRVLPKGRITCVDASARMLMETRRRLERHGLQLDSIDLVHADALDWTPDAAGFDLIVTHFFLDCFRPDQLDALLAKLAGAANRRATWLLGDFQTPDAGLSRWRARLILWGMHVFFRAVTNIPARKLTAPDPYLAKHNFKLRQRKVSDWGLLHSDWWERMD